MSSSLLFLLLLVGYASASPPLLLGRISDTIKGSGDDVGEADLYPLYECGKQDVGVPVTSWYGACRGACSMTHNTTDASLEIFFRNDSVGWIDVLSLQTTPITKSSHVTWYGECEKTTDVGSSMPAPADIIDRITPLLLEGLQTWPYGGAVHVHDTIGHPECKYTSDRATSGWRVLISKRTIELKSDIAGEGYIVDPDLGYVFPVSDGKGRGRYWWVWAQSNIPHQGCYFKSAGEANCTLLMDTYTYSCPNLNVAFSARVGTHLSDTCVGDVNISTDGITYKILSHKHVGSISNQLIELWHQSQEALTQQLIIVINDALGKIETSYCESTCDLTEMIVSQNSERPMVIETPVGPWLPSSKNGGLSVVPCQSEPGLVVITPVETCLSPFLLKVKSMKSGDTFWWNPIDSHVSPETLCLGHDEDEIYLRSQTRKPLMFEFWKGAYIIDYPYNTTGHWLSNPGGHIHRSSKWFPSISSLIYTVPINLPMITKGVDHKVKQVMSTVGDLGNSTSAPWYGWLIPITKKTARLVGNVSMSILIWWRELESEVKNSIIFIGLIILGLLISLPILKYLFSSRPSYTPVKNTISWSGPK
uniref:Glycoprotein n=1 Tax=Morogoro maize-associated virus TaxID=2497337 RepID=A0A3Q9D1H7_9RHAB|nr:glycoprotein [Morogoro maize-associated virus]